MSVHATVVCALLITHQKSVKKKKKGCRMQRSRKRVAAAASGLRERVEQGIKTAYPQALTSLTDGICVKVFHGFQH